MPPKAKKVRETFNALGVTGGAPKFKQHIKSARKPTSWERKALKATKAHESEQTEATTKIVKDYPRAPHHPTSKKPLAAKAGAKHPHQHSEPSSSSSCSSSDDSSSDDSASSGELRDRQRTSKGTSGKVSSKTKKIKKEKIVSVTFEHFPVEERDFHGISVSPRARNTPFAHQTRTICSSLNFSLTVRMMQGLLSSFLGGFEYHAGDLADLCIEVGRTVSHYHGLLWLLHELFSISLVIKRHPGWLCAESRRGQRCSWNIDLFEHVHARQTAQHSGNILHAASAMPKGKAVANQASAFFTQHRSCRFVANSQRITHNFLDWFHAALF